MLKRQNCFIENQFLCQLLSPISLKNNVCQHICFAHTNTSFIMRMYGVCNYAVYLKTTQRSEG